MMPMRTVIGVYGKFMALAEKNVILNEMRADLMTTTRNSSPFLKEISEHNVSPNNPYANPKDFYVVIQNCNNVLKNFDIMLEKSDLPRNNMTSVTLILEQFAVGFTCN